MPAAGAGSGIQVNVVEITLVGSAAGNYTLTSAAATTTANINKATPGVTVSDAGGTYSPGNTAPVEDLRIVEWNVESDTGGAVGQIGGVDAGPGLSTVFQAFGAENLNGNAQPVDVLALEELNGTGANANNATNATLQYFVTQLNNIYGAGTYAYDTTTDPTDGAGTTGNGPSGLIYDTHTVQDLGAVAIGTVGSSGAARAPMRYELAPVGGNSSDDFYMYVEHAKSGSTSSDMSRRDVEVQEVRQDAATLGASAHVIYTGDFNVTSSTEAAYQDMISSTLIPAGVGQAIDPANPANNWTDTSTFRGLLTETAINLQFRDDFQFVTSPFQSGSGLQSIAGSYEVFGNNGSLALHSAVNAAGNTALSDLSNQSAVLTALTTVTDHLPILADYAFNTAAPPMTFPATAAVNGGSSLEGVTPTLAYYTGSTATGTSTSTAPSAVGTYTVVATFPGSADFTSVNSSPVTFTIDPPAPTLTVSDAGGTYNGSPFPGTAIVNGGASLEGVTPTLAYYVGGTASGTSTTTAPTAAGTYTVVANFAGSTDFGATSSTPVTFTISQATPTVTVNDAGGTFTGNPFPATALVNGGASLEGVTPTLAYYVGSIATGTSTSTAPSAIGTYTVVASFAGSTDYAAASSAPVGFTISSAPSAATVTIPLGITATAGQAAKVNVPISITGLDTTSGLLSADFVITYNPALLSISTVSLSSDLSDNDWSISKNLATPGILRVSLFSTDDPAIQTSPEQLLNLAFTVPSGSSGSSVIGFSTAPGDVNDLNEGQFTLTANSGSVVITGISQSTPTVTVSDAGGTFTGNPFPATALVNGAASLEGVTPTLAYYVGSAATGTPSSTAPSAAGTYTVVASFAGSTDYAAASSAPVTFTVSPAPAPTLSAQAFTISSKSVAGAVVGTVAATPAYSGQVINYSIGGGTDSTGGAFAIDPTTGVITVANPSKLPAFALHATSATATFFVTVADSTNSSFANTAEMTVTLTAAATEPPIVASSTASFSVPENSKAGAIVGTITGVTAAYTGQTFAYSLSGTDAGSFAISSKGVITAKTELVFLTQSSYSLTVNVADGKNPLAFSPIATTITVTELAPTVGGTVAGQALLDTKTLAPFAKVSIGDVVPTQSVSVTVTLDHPANGTFTAASLSAVSGTTWTLSSPGVYTVSGTAANVTKAIEKLVFSPTANEVVPGSTVTTNFTVAVNDGTHTTTNNSTTVVVTSVNNAPTITGTIAKQPTTDKTAVNPFPSVTISDPDVGQTLSVIVTLDSALKGSFTAASLTASGFVAGGTAGSYTLTAAASSTQTAAQVATAALGQLVFQPSQNRVAVNKTETTTFTISVADSPAGVSKPVTNNKSSVVSSSVNDAPTISGTVTAPQTVTDKTTVTPFSTVAFGDVDPSTKLTVDITLNSTLNGKLVGLFKPVSLTGQTGYQFTGTPAAATAAIQALVFKPTANQVVPGSTVTTGFTIAFVDNSGLSGPTNSDVSVVSTSVNDAPVIGGTSTTAQKVNDNKTLAPFIKTTIADADPGQTETVTVSLDDAAKGTFTSDSLSTSSFIAGTGTGSTGNGLAVGSYQFLGTAAEAQAAIRELVFQPTDHLVTPKSTFSTNFTISVSDSPNGVSSPVTDTKTTVITTAVNTLPTLTGTVGGQVTTDNTPLAAFSGVTISDPDSANTAVSPTAVAQNVTVTVTLGNTAQGALSGGGFTSAGKGAYTFTGTAAAATTAINALTFTPTPNRIAIGKTDTASFSVAVVDASGGKSAVDKVTTVVVSPVEDTVTGLTYTQVANLKGPLAAGKAVGSLTPTDADGTTDTYTYTYTFASGGADNAKFVFGTGKTAGELLVAPGTTLAKGATYTVMVKATNSGGGSSFTKSVTITLG